MRLIIASALMPNLDLRFLMWSLYLCGMRAYSEAIIKQQQKQDWLLLCWHKYSLTLGVAFLLRPSWWWRFVWGIVVGRLLLPSFRHLRGFGSFSIAYCHNYSNNRNFIRRRWVSSDWESPRDSWWIRKRVLLPRRMSTKTTSLFYVCTIGYASGGWGHCIW